MLANPGQTTTLRFPKSSLPGLSHSGLADLGLTGPGSATGLGLAG